MELKNRTPGHNSSFIMLQTHAFGTQAVTLLLQRWLDGRQGCLMIFCLKVSWKFKWQLISHPLAWIIGNYLVEAHFPFISMEFMHFLILLPLMALSIHHPRQLPLRKGDNWIGSNCKLSSLPQGNTFHPLEEAIYWSQSAQLYWGCSASQEDKKKSC